MRAHWEIIYSFAWGHPHPHSPHPHPPNPHPDNLGTNFVPVDAMHPCPLYTPLCMMSFADLVTISTRSGSSCSAAVYLSTYVLTPVIIKYCFITIPLSWKIQIARETVDQTSLLHPPGMDCMLCKEDFWERHAPT